MAETATKVGFTITAEGLGCTPAARGPKHFLLDVDEKKCVRIGRAPGNDIQVELRGCSQFHAEIRLLPSEEDGLPPRLVVRDLSMNGTGLKLGDDKPAVGAKKDQDLPLYHDMQILVPFQLKTNQTPEDRAWLKLSFDDPDMGALPTADRHADGDAGGGPAPGVRKKAENGEKEDKEDDEENEKDDGEEDGEKDDGEAREAFVDLLVKTKAISVGTSYEDAERMLCKKAAWKAVDAQTRKECFEIFVDHLDDVGHKKKKKKDKAKKNKKKKQKEDEEEEEAEEGPRKKKNKKGEKRKAKVPKKSSVSS